MSSSSTPPPPTTPLRGGTTAHKCSPFTPGARQTALHRLPLHLCPLTFDEEEEEEDEDDGEFDDTEDATSLPAENKRQSSQGLPPKHKQNRIRPTLPLPAASPSTQQALSPRAWSPSFRPSTPIEKGFHLDPHDLTFGDRLAEGAYGVVWRARLRRRRVGRRLGCCPQAEAEGGETEKGGTGGGHFPNDEREEEEEVAVKVQRVPHDEQEQANLLIELSILHGLIHPRLVRYYGAALLSEEEAQANDEWRPLLEGPHSKEGPAIEERAMGVGKRWKEEEGVEGRGGGRGGGGMAGVEKEEEEEEGEDPTIHNEEVDIHTPTRPESAAVPSSSSSSSSSSTSSSLVLIAMELCLHGSLRDALHPVLHPGLPPGLPPLLTWSHRVRLASDIAEGLTFLHAHHLLHRDLKTTNILLLSPSPSSPIHAGPRAQICDHAFVSSSSSPDLASYTCGTFEFQAPEVLLNEPGTEVGGKADVFSLGVVLCEMITGRIPGACYNVAGEEEEEEEEEEEGRRLVFLERRAEDLFEVRGEEVEEAVLPGCPPSLMMLALQCVGQEAEERPTAREAWEWAAALWKEMWEEEGEEGGRGRGVMEEEEEEEEEGRPPSSPSVEGGMEGGRGEGQGREDREGGGGGGRREGGEQGGSEDAGKEGKEKRTGNGSSGQRRREGGQRRHKKQQQQQSEQQQLQGRQQQKHPPQQQQHQQLVDDAAQKQPASTGAGGGGGGGGIAAGGGGGAERAEGGGGGKRRRRRNQQKKQQQRAISSSSSIATNHTQPSSSSSSSSTLSSIPPSSFSSSMRARPSKGPRDAKVLPSTTATATAPRTVITTTTSSSHFYKLPPPTHPSSTFSSGSKPQIKNKEKKEEEEGEEDVLLPLLSCCAQSWEAQWKTLVKKVEGGMEALREGGMQGGRKGVVGRLERLQGMMKEEVLPVVSAMEQSMAAMRMRIG